MGNRNDFWDDSKFFSSAAGRMMLPLTEIGKLRVDQAGKEDFRGYKR